VLREAGGDAEHGAYIEDISMPKRVISDPTPTMIARASLAEAEGDVLRATDIMVERVMSDTRLYKILMDPLVKTACFDAIKTQCGRESRRIGRTGSCLWNCGTNPNKSLTISCPSQ
jgi:hypothetical protein